MNVDYYSKFMVVKKVESMMAEDQIWVTKFVFIQFGLPQKFLSDTGTNFVSEQFKEFCRCLNIDQAATSSYPEWSNEQVEACIKFVKYTRNADRIIMMLTLVYFR